MRHRNGGRQTLERVDDERKTVRECLDNEVSASHGVSSSDTAAAEKSSGQLVFQIITLCCAY